MMRWLAVFLFCVASPMAAAAKPVPVATGDHDGFTRLVLEFGQIVDWQVGRTSDGYELRLKDSLPTYDLSDVYRLIGRNRLAAIWADPQTGALRIGIGCACHALPFEFRPGILVIDLRDGPPPKGSSFELALGGESLPDLAAKPVPRPKSRPESRPEAPPEAIAGTYDWKAIALGGNAQETKVESDPPMAENPLPGSDPGLQPLRAALLQQLSRGVAQGVVDMGKPGKPASPADADFASTQIRIGEDPGITLNVAEEDSALTAEGAECVRDERLNIAEWADERSIAAQIADAMTGMAVEFDRPDPKAVARAIRFQLHLGFGAEARGILRALPTKQPDTAIWTSMAHILDGEADQSPAFSGMLACDSAASLWAMLSDPAPTRGEPLNTAAVLRTFSGLPVHLRRHLGPPLADRFLALDDPGAAQTIRNAILRAPGAAGPEVALLEAKLDAEAGDHAAAEERLTEIAAASGPGSAEALVRLLEERISQARPVDALQVVALEGFLQERKGSAEDPRFRRVLTLARAAAGDFNAAFAAVDDQPGAEADLWRLLVQIGTDTDLLSHATLESGVTPPAVAVPVARQAAERLLGLGFADQARAWLGVAKPPDPILAARIDLQRKDARSALTDLAGVGDPAAESLRAQALSMLGDQSAAAEVYAGLGETEAEWRAINRSRDWERVAANGLEPWQGAAAAATPVQADGSLPGNAADLADTAAALVPPPGEGPLARGRKLLDSSTRTRLAVTELLAAVASPNVQNP